MPRTVFVPHCETDCCPLCRKMNQPYILSTRHPSDKSLCFNVYDRYASLRGPPSQGPSGEAESVRNASHSIMAMKSLVVAVVTIVSLQVSIFCLIWTRLHSSTGTSRWEVRQGRVKVDIWDVIDGHLAVVVPIGAGEGARAMEAIERWPRVCSEITLHKVDLFLYYSEGLNGKDEYYPVPEEASRCFRSTKTISANIASEVRVGDSPVTSTKEGYHYYCMVSYYSWPPQ